MTICIDQIAATGVITYMLVSSSCDRSFAIFFHRQALHNRNSQSKIADSASLCTRRGAAGKWRLRQTGLGAYCIFSKAMADMRVSSSCDHSVANFFHRPALHKWIIRRQLKPPDYAPVFPKVLLGWEGGTAVLGKAVPASDVNSQNGTSPLATSIWTCVSRSTSGAICWQLWIIHHFFEQLLEPHTEKA